ncbi:protein of unknown function [Pedococcus dokdonensis]|uniref:DUF4397 domain-containing protein n=1 Tax=Pedococcus dokdonensis TaxID=443156 RepID=A0A1H0UFU2_9MICO|nr:DUF4397 domain-containing protein [Pedococcus dokdonensis]SDP64905.1 protein of unknown function [Pedococcus dokdonensis]
MQARHGRGVLSLFVAASVSWGATGVAVAAGPQLPAGPAAVGATAKGSLYVIQGVDATTMTLSLDGKVLRTAAPAKTVLGPLSVAPGRHTLKAEPAGGGPAVEATVTVQGGASADVVLHRQADATLAPVFTTYKNDLSPVTAGSGRLAVAHTAAVGPADIRVKGEVLFSNVANGEQLSLTVPRGSYPVDIVPTASTAPVVFGPVDLPVAAASLTRVFAIGVAATDSMDAVVQVLPIATRGSGADVSRVDAGSGGQAQALIAAHRAGVPDSGGQPQWWLPFALAAGLAGLLVAVGVRLAAKSVPVPVRVDARRRRS